MMKRRGLAALLAVLALLGAGCDGGSGDPSGAQTPAKTAETVIEEPKAALSMLPSSEPVFEDPVLNLGFEAAETVASAANAFSLSLLRQEAGSGENVLIPSFALFSAMAGQGRLFVGELSAQELDESVSRLLHTLIGVYETPDLSPYQTAQLLVSAQGALDEARRETLQQTYLFELASADMSLPELDAAVNAYFGERLGEQTFAVTQDLAQNGSEQVFGGVFYRDRFLNEWSDGGTAIFAETNGDQDAAMLRYDQMALGYYENDDIQVAEIPFNRGGVLYLVLPVNGDPGEWLRRVSEEDFLSISEGLACRSVTVTMPELTLAATKDYREAMAQEGAEIEGLGGVTYHAKLEIDALGTGHDAPENILVTACTGGVTDPEPREMMLNRPFAFFLCDSTFDGGVQILMGGIVNEIPE